MGGEILILDAMLLHETDAAYLVQVDDVEAWVPKSQVEFEVIDRVTDEGELQIPEWLAIDKGLV